MTRAIAFYLPQFYPVPENDEWWGKGFTEWTNVGRAKPLFRGHYQPRVPSDLGYYDLRVPEVRIAQANLARQAGIEGFCYWHYWFAGRRLLTRVFNEVVESGRPNFPFCLCWANHSWKAKSWNPKVTDRLLIEQTYPGEKDYANQFYELLPAFKDPRYMTVDGRLIYGIFNPSGIPDMDRMSIQWNRLARDNGLKGFYFFGFAQGSGSLVLKHQDAYDCVVYDLMFDAAYINRQRIVNKVLAKLSPLFHKPVPLDYSLYTKVALQKFEQYPQSVPCVVPNFDHTPRSEWRYVIMNNSTPEKWGTFCHKASILAGTRGKWLVVYQVME